MINEPSFEPVVQNNVGSAGVIVIISHKFKFIFIKTVKTAGTSIEVFLSPLCDDKDIITPIFPMVNPHVARNYKGLSNPLSDMLLNRGRGLNHIIKQLCCFNKFYNHIPARFIRTRVSRKIWDSYLKFCVERNPWDKTISHYHMMNYRSGGNMSLDDYFALGRFCINYPKYTDGKNNLIVDKVVRYERLENDLSDIFYQVGVPFNGKLGVNAKAEYRKDQKTPQEVLSRAQREQIESVFKKEIQMHNYRY